MAAHNEFGARAERLAADFLTARGWTILDRNWRWRHKEIDLIVRRSGLVAFVEVRARRSTSHGHPFETIGWRKRRDLEAAARAWLERFGGPRDEYRFDVIAVLEPTPDVDRTGHDCAAAAATLEHLEDAWIC